MAAIIINGNTYSFEKGESILDVANRNGVHIPTLCYLKEITPIGACRLCLVQVDGAKRLQAACVTYAMDGMKVETDNEYIWTHRKQMLDFILIKHPLDCPVCDKAGECMLQDTAYEFGMMTEKVSSEKPKDPKANWNKIVYNSNLCVLCERCIKSCHEMTGCSALKMEDRGFYNHVVPSEGDTLNCDFCGTCIDRCPVGALLDTQFHNQARVWDLTETVTASPFSASEGDIVYGVLDGKIERGKSVEGAQISSQSRFGFNYIENPSRIKTPLVKSNGEAAPKSWEEVMTVLKDRLAGCKPENTAMLMGSRLTSEAIAAYKALMAAVGSKKIVTEADFTKPVFMKKYKEKFGTFANIGRADDLKNCDVIFVIGADLRREAVGLKWRMMNSVIHNGCKLITVGLKRYEYDVFTNKSLLADSGDFGGIFEKIRTDNAEAFCDIRDYINEGKRVGIIVGNEYTSACPQPEAVLAFADFIGKEKMSCFMVANDKTNIYGLYAQELFAGGYSADELIKDLEAKNIKNLFLVGFNNTYTGDTADKLNNALRSAETVVAVDLFNDGTSARANVFLPAKAALEVDGSFVKIGGRVSKVRKVVDTPGEQKSDTEIASMLAGLFKASVPACPEEIYNTMLAGRYGYPEVKFTILDSCLVIRTSPVFNETPFKYEQPKSADKTVSINPRHHSGTITAKANFTVRDEFAVQNFHFEQTAETISAETCECAAKGVKLVTRKF
ncbi:molybdopterin-dependent oxidoreductase [Geovibrio ferrireducens]|uniref:molybdopterin-dependent oxidoreductase n=1 Tax=Geovibrio ferrireducens TaxID=46201 RepID=UPI002245EA35|nr:molybdopterin-dependent oxidoreductase [Geovibrio ferrireducens]